jgi:glyceraldehyde-3-phosphate dehydrogenase/erythrose-4-phosphate dehydrogenase
MINIKKINIQDFSSDNQKDISKLARSLNPFFDDVQKKLTKGLTVDENLPFEYVQFDVIVDAAGNPVSSTKVNYSLTANLKGALVINADAANSFPTSTPYVSYSINANILTINKVFGIPNNVKFKITMLLLS